MKVQDRGEIASCRLRALSLPKNSNTSMLFEETLQKGFESTVMIFATTYPLKIHIHAAIRDILWTEKILKQNSHHFLSQDIHFSEKLACSSL